MRSHQAGRGGEFMTDNTISSALPASTSSVSKMSSPWLFFVLALGWSWLFWIPAAVLGLSFRTPAGALLGLVGMLGPMLAAIGLTYFTEGVEGKRDYWLRIVDFKRIGPRWYLVIFLFVPVLMSVTACLDILSGGSAEPFKQAARPFLSSPLSIIPYALVTMFIGPFPEELGWRGYVLDRLQTKFNALLSGLILGVVWALWHVPLFFIKDTYQYNQGAWSEWFWLFMIGIIPLSVIFTWIFNNTNRSTLAVILFHFMVNFTDQILNATMRTDLYSTILWILAALVVAVIWGPKTLTKST
jgi:membrane protease YdiL (CAAX protease family)